MEPINRHKPLKCVFFYSEKQYKQNKEGAFFTDRSINYIDEVCYTEMQSGEWDEDLKSNFPDAKIVCIKGADIDEFMLEAYGKKFSKNIEGITSKPNPHYDPFSDPLYNTRHIF